MAAPNIVNVTTITGKLTPYAVTNTLASTGVANATSSGKLLRVNSIIASNVLGSAASTLSVTVYRGTTHTCLVKTLPVPANASVVILGKADGGLNLEEGDTLYAQAGASSAVEMLVSYDEIS